MKEWLTAREIADEALPGLPRTERALQIMADREGWNRDVFRARRRTGRGGGMEYHIGLLPSLAQVSYRQRSIPVGPLPEAADPQPGAALSGRAALERDARLAILRAYDAFERGQRLNRQGCEALFVAKYQAGTFAVEAWVTASRVATLPAASSVNPGKEICLQDASGACSSAKTVTGAAAGSDTINGAGSVVLSSAYAAVRVRSDGAAAWLIVAQVPAGTGTATGVDPGTY